MGDMPVSQVMISQKSAAYAPWRTAPSHIHTVQQDVCPHKLFCGAAQCCDATCTHVRPRPGKAEVGGRGALHQDAGDGGGGIFGGGGA